MIVSGLLSGGAPVIQSFQVGGTATNAGEPVYAPATAGPGVIVARTAGTGVANYVGLTLNAQTASTTQGSAETLNRVVVNGDAIIRSRMAGNNSSGSIVLVATVTTADTSGLTVVDSALTMSRVLDGVLFGISGANVGQIRIVTSDSTSTATVTQPFDNGVVVGDTFGICTLNPGSQLNEPVGVADGTEFDVSTTLDTTAHTFMPMALDVNGVTDSSVLVVPSDSIFAGNTAN